jgi:hypothetical protein
MILTKRFLNAKPLLRVVAFGAGHPQLLQSHAAIQLRHLTQCWPQPLRPSPMIAPH